MSTPFGILNVDKPAGLTSRDVVNRIEGLVRNVKCGHAGTLDPLATGVLVVCVGPATRLIQYVQRLPKQYRAVFQLGRKSVTDDVEGDVELVAGAPEPTRVQIEAALPQFLGDVEQRPPAHSAIKVDGQRSYERARRGEEFELPARTITIHRLEILRYEYPELELAIECGSGTYVRSLGRDLAAALGTAAVMSALVRTAIGDFRLEDAVALDALTNSTLAEHLQPPIDALEVPTADRAQRPRAGRAPPRPPDRATKLQAPHGGECRSRRRAKHRMGGHRSRGPPRRNPLREAPQPTLAGTEFRGVNQRIFRRSGVAIRIFVVGRDSQTRIRDTRYFTTRTNATPSKNSEIDSGSAARPGLTCSRALSRKMIACRSGLMGKVVSAV